VAPGCQADPFGIKLKPGPVPGEAACAPVPGKSARLWQCLFPALLLLVTAAEPAGASPEDHDDRNNLTP